MKKSGLRIRDRYIILDLTVYPAIRLFDAGEKSVMTTSDLFQKRKALFLGVLFVAFFMFTVDILDLREELRILSCPYNCLDSDIATGLISTAAFGPELFYIMVFRKMKASVTISFIHLLPYGFRAPPAKS
jgi:hypothetical protein